jgi:hypothetical protein
MKIVSRPADFSQRDYREARYMSGFGCIRCGCTIYRYCAAQAEAEAEAQAGPESGIPFLLCTPCRDMLNGFDQGESVLAVLRRSPLPVQAGFYRDLLPYMRGYNLPDTRLAGGAIMRQTAVPIMLGGKPVLGLGPPETYGGPAQISVTLGAGDGRPVAIVKSNEWLVEDGSWQFERRGNRYAFRSADGAAELTLTFGTDKAITIEKLHSRVGAQELAIDGGGARLDGATVTLPNVDSQIIGVSF